MVVCTFPLQWTKCCELVISLVFTDGHASVAVNKLLGVGRQFCYDDNVSLASKAIRLITEIARSKRKCFEWSGKLWCIWWYFSTVLEMFVYLLGSLIWRSTILEESLLAKKIFALQLCEKHVSISHLALLFEDVPVVEFMYLVFTCTPGEGCCRQLRSLLLCQCVTSFKCWLTLLILVFTVLTKLKWWLHLHYSERNPSRKQNWLLCFVLLLFLLFIITNITHNYRNVGTPVPTMDNRHIYKYTCTGYAYIIYKKEQTYI